MTETDQSPGLNYTHRPVWTVVYAMSLLLLTLHRMAILAIKSLLLLTNYDLT